MKSSKRNDAQKKHTIIQQIMNIILISSCSIVFGLLVASFFLCLDINFQSFKEQNIPFYSKVFMISFLASNMAIINNLYQKTEKVLYCLVVLISIVLIIYYAFFANFTAIIDVLHHL